MIRTIDRIGTRRLTTTISSALAMVLVAGVAAPVQAQATDRERAAQNPGEWEWEADEGYHREEWYDPSDWFDGETTIDYEYDWYEWDAADDYDYQYVDYTDDYDWYDAYWDGYYDGYYDDVYGYDYDVDLSTWYGDGYTSGYADGFYDANVGYDYDPYYYVYTWDYDAAPASERQRAGDEARKRGDRAAQGQRQDRDTQRQRDDAQKTMKREKDLRRVRGEVKRIEFLRGTEEEGKNLIARVTFEEEDKSRVVNLGPKMSAAGLPFTRGDIVTFKGVREKHDDRTVLKTYKLNVNGEEFALAGPPRQKGDERQQGQARQTTQLQGTIRNIGSVDIDREKYTVLRVELRDGTSEIVAFSDKRVADKDAFKAKPGDRITIRGRERELDGRKVIRPERVMINGEQLAMR